MNKIYFAGSIKGGSEKKESYLNLIEYLSKFNEILTEHIWNEDLSLKANKEAFVYVRDTSWIDKSDIIIAEVSVPSLGVGYELGYAEAKNKRIICLYDVNSEKELSYMISGNKYNEIIKYENLEEVKEKLKEIL